MGRAMMKTMKTPAKLQVPSRDQLGLLLSFLRAQKGPLALFLNRLKSS